MIRCGISSRSRSTFVSPQYLITRRGLAPNSMRELVDLAKREPGKLNYASIGPGSSVHLAAELLKMLAGIDMTHVPYSGSGPAVRDTIAGPVDLTFTAGGMTYADQAKVLGVTSAKRTAAAPQVPAIAETVPGYEATIWFGFLAPAGTPKETVDRLARDMNKAVEFGRVARAAQSRRHRGRARRRYTRGVPHPHSEGNSALARRDQGRQYPAGVSAWLRPWES